MKKISNKNFRIGEKIEFLTARKDKEPMPVTGYFLDYLPFRKINKRFRLAIVFGEDRYDPVNIYEYTTGWLSVCGPLTGRWSVDGLLDDIYIKNGMDAVMKRIDELPVLNRLPGDEVYVELKEPRLVDFDTDIARYCQLKYYDSGEKTGDSGEKCRSISKRKDEAYCSNHDCPLCECPTLDEIRQYDEREYQKILSMISSDDIESFTGEQVVFLPCTYFGNESVIQYYEVQK